MKTKVAIIKNLNEAFPNILGVYSHRFMPTLSYKGKCEEVLKLLIYYIYLIFYLSYYI